MNQLKGQINPTFSRREQKPINHAELNLYPLINKRDKCVYFHSIQEQTHILFSRANKIIKILQVYVCIGCMQWCEEDDEN